MTDPLNKRCPACHAMNVSSHQFCGICGNELDEAEKDTATTPEPSQPGPKAKKKRRVQGNGKEPAWRLGPVFGQIVLAVIVIGALFSHPLIGLLIIIAVGVLLVSEPGRIILAFLIRSLVVVGLLAILAGIGGGIYWVVAEQVGKKSVPDYYSQGFPEARKSYSWDDMTKMSDTQLKKIAQGNTPHVSDPKLPPDSIPLDQMTEQQIMAANVLAERWQNSNNETER